MTNRWNHPVHIPPARRHGSGVRRRKGDPLPLVVSRRRASLQAFDAAASIAALACVLFMALLWRALIQR